MTKTPHLTIRLSGEDRQRLERLARKLGDVSVSAVVRHLIREADKKEEHDHA